MARRIGLALIWGLVSGHNMPDPRLYLISWGPMLLGLAIGYRLVKNTAARPTLGQGGQWCAALWLAVIYIASFFLIRTEATPPAPALLITLALYALLALLLKRTRQRAPEPQGAIATPARMPLIWLMIVFAIGLATSISISAGIGLASGIVTLPFASMIFLGAGLFVWLVVWQGGMRKP